MMKVIGSLVILLIAITFTEGRYAPLLNSDSPSAIKDSYIIILKDGLEATDRDNHIQRLRDNITSSNSDAEIGFVYDVVLGFSAKLTQELLLEELMHPNVKYVEVDQVFSITKDQTKIQPYETEETEDTITQKGATWGITRISQRDLKLNGEYTYNAAAGNGVDVFVFDTGILTTHVDFGGRASFFFSSITGEPTTDGNGHGTHVAGTIGGTTYGVAKKVNLKSVKVLDERGDGTTAGIIAGVDEVTMKRDPSRTPIASMSIEGPATPALDQAIQNSIRSGIVYVASAGNFNSNACNYSPARIPEVITVGATTKTDSRASYSNYGNCLNIFAPGTSIVSDYIGSNKAIQTLSGTSMAAPHVTGALAIHLSLYPSLSPLECQKWVMALATPNKMNNPGIGSPNILLYSPSN